MGFFQRKVAMPHTERRAVRRISVDCAAVLRLAGGDRTGRLRDLSEVGARFDCTATLAQGTTGLLIWDGHEHFCKIAWAGSGTCGVVFDKALAAGLVASYAQAEGTAGPVAQFGKIPLGQRRIRPLV